MKPWVALLTVLPVCPLAAFAGPAVVTSGEHPGFTRLVVQFDGPVNWQVGRGIDGYSLRVQDQRPDYDMTKAFDLIGKSRLAALWADPKTGDLHFGIACACYGMPFEFRPGIVVLDLHDGAPPQGSSFEQPLDAALQPVAVAAPPKPQPASAYDWTTVKGNLIDRWPNLLGTFGPLSVDLNPLDSGLEPLRLSLIEEMGRGASQGIVDMAKPKKSAEVPLSEGDPSVRIHMGETPTMVVRQKGEGRAPLTAQGEECITDAQLDIPTWGSGRPVADQIGPEREGLTGEFDKPDPDAVTRAVRFMLFLGFGAEARSLIRAFPDGLHDKEIWESLAHIMDDEPNLAPVLQGMEECDTAAALWATLADPDARPNEELGKAAVLRSFSALPPHLRRLLGSRLVDRFLAAEDISTATALRDAVLRAPGDAGPEVILMQAAMARAAGEPGQAESHLEPLASAPGPASADALVALVEQRVTLGQSVEFAQVQTLEELLRERKGGSDAPKYQHALVLARAASGDFDRAFADVTEVPDAEAALWRLLAVGGQDSALLDHATLGEGQVPPLVAKGVASLIADRFLGLGLADQAAQWLEQDDRAPALLRARVDLARGNPKDALAQLDADDSPAALAVKARALQDLNDEQAAAEVFAKLGKPEDQWAALSRSQAWEALAQGGPDPWKAVASVVTNPPTDAAAANPASQGPLARNKTLVADSAATRDAITALLNSVKTPVLPSQ